MREDASRGSFGVARYSQLADNIDGAKCGRRSFEQVKGNMYLFCSATFMLLSGSFIYTYRQGCRSAKLTLPTEEAHVLAKNF